MHNVATKKTFYEYVGGGAGVGKGQIGFYNISVNIDTNDGLVNGATGQLMRMDNCMVNSSFLVTGLWIKFTRK